MAYNNSAKNQLEPVTGSRATYYPFGDYRGIPPAQTLTDRGFTGQKSNNQPGADLGLLYYNARYYAPGIARFLSADTLVPDPANPQAFNRYAYTLNNPVRFTDPAGRCTENSHSGDEYEEDYGCWEVYHKLWAFIHADKQRFFVSGSIWLQKGIWQELAKRNTSELSSILNLLSQSQAAEPSLYSALELYGQGKQYPGQTINAVLSPSDAQSLIETLGNELVTANTLDSLGNFLEIIGVNEIVEVFLPEIGVPISQIDTQGQDLQNLIQSLQVAINNGDWVHISGGLHLTGWSIEINGVTIVNRTHLIWSGPLSIISSWLYNHRNQLNYPNLVH